MIFITSRDNVHIKHVKKLKEKKFRAESLQFIVEGFRFVEEALASSFIVEEVFVKESSLEKFNDKLNKYIENMKIFVVSDNVFKAISSTENSQGILALVNMKVSNPEVNRGVYILVDQVQDPGNLGTIIRTAQGAGCVGVILTKGTVDVYNEKTLRSTMGSIFKIPIIEDVNLYFTKTLLSKEYKLVSSSLDTDDNFYDVDLKGNIIIAVGNEGNGISDEVYELSSYKVKIPMPGNSESLNVSIAAAIMIYESLRQKNI